MNRLQSFRGSAAMCLFLSLLGGCVDEDGAASPAGEVLAEDGVDVAGPALVVDVASERAAFRAGDRVIVEVTFSNPTDRPIRLLTWGETAAELLADDLFAVTVDGAPARYIGPHYKRPSPQDGDYTTLAPGDSLTRTADISDLYDLTRSGTYRVRYADAHGHAGARARVESSVVDLRVAGRPLPRRGDDQPRIGAVSYTKCTASQQGGVLEALQASSVMADGAASYLNGAASGTPRYTKWFGAFNNAGWNTAKSHYTAIKDAIDSKSLQFDCGCKKQYYAYVYPDAPYKVYLCKAFWTAPVSGTDSRGGTIIHELSHFDVTAGTDDHAYGQSAASSLAASSPAQALDNADNHEYFAENTPTLQ